MSKAAVAGLGAGPGLEPFVADGTLPAIVANLVLGEIVGWDACPPPPLRGCDPRPAIYPTLHDRLERLGAGSSHALAPSPPLDRALRRLVELITRHFGIAIAGPPAARDRYHVEVVGRILDRLGADQELAERASTVRRAAAAAEEAMERYYGLLAVQMLDEDGPGRDRLTEIGGGEPLGLPWYTTPRLDRSSERSRRMAVLRAALGRFPYGRNYEQLTVAELTALQAATPTLRSVAFCGAGPLPLTGIMLHVLTDAPVTLVEVDVEAAALAGRLVDHLVDLEVVGRGSVEVVLADAASAELGHCDVVIVASLVAQPSMLRLAARLARSGGAAPNVLMVRSAAGLVSQFAYEPIAIGAVEALGYRHLGEVAPLASVTMSASVDDRRVAVPLDSPDLLAIADQDVLNRTELFGLRR